MIAVDTNILIYAFQQNSTHHDSALAKLRELAEGTELWSIPVFCIGEFIRVVTHPRLFDKPAALREALSALEALLKSPSARILFPGNTFWNCLVEASEEAQSIGNHIFDAQIVALLREHGVDQLLTEDRDFLRFKRMKVMHLD